MIEDIVIGVLCIVIIVLGLVGAYIIEHYAGPSSWD